MPPEPSRRGNLPGTFLSQLNRGDPRSAAVTLTSLARRPGWLDTGAFRELARRAEPFGALFLDALLLAEEVTFGRIMVAAKALELAAATGRLEELRKRIDQLAANGGLATLKFGVEDLLVKLPRHSSALADLARLKYGDCVGRRFTDSIELAEHIAQRIELPRRFADRLYGESRRNDMKRDDWERRLRIAFAIDHISSDKPWLTTHLRRETSFNIVARSSFLVDEAEQAARPARTEGSLFVILHGGFLSFALDSFVRLHPDGLIVRRQGGARRPNTLVLQDPRFGLFQIVRALENGTSILMTPDAAVGTRSALVRIFDAEFAVPEGAPFVAYETGCQTFWLWVRRDGRRFVPELVAGPARLDGERYASFKQRWLEFYGEQVNNFLRGAPDNLALRPQWTRWLSARAIPVSQTSLERLVAPHDAA